MFGNKYIADEIAQNFYNKVAQLKKAKEASKAAVIKEASNVNAEDFLVDHMDDVNLVAGALDSKIKDMSSMAKDCKCGKKGCEKCNKAEDMKNCAMCGASYAKDHACTYAKDKKPQASEARSTAPSSMTLDTKNSNHAKDHAESGIDNSIVDKKAQYVLFELGKVAADLRNSGNKFAADMVEVTAMDIKNEEVKKVAKKLEVISELKKVASQSISEGDIFTADIIEATIQNIKKS